MVRQCCQCRRVHVVDRWIPIPHGRELPDPSRVTHTYCGACLEALKSDARQAARRLSRSA